LYFRVIFEFSPALCKQTKLEHIVKNGTNEISLYKDKCIFLTESDNSKIQLQVKEYEAILLSFLVMLGIANDDFKGNIKIGKPTLEISNDLVNWRQIRYTSVSIKGNAVVNLTAYKVGSETPDQRVERLVKQLSTHTLESENSDKLISYLYQILQKAYKEPQYAMFYYGYIWDVIDKNEIENPLNEEENKLFKKRQDNSIKNSRHLRVTKDDFSKQEELPQEELNQLYSIAKKLVEAYVRKQIKIYDISKKSI